MQKSAIDEKTSQLLERLASELLGKAVPIGVLLYRLRRRSFGGLLMLLSVLCLIPGVAVFSGLLIMVFGAQLALGFRAPALPRFLAGYTIEIDRLKSILHRLAARIAQVERIVKPRYSILTLAPVTTFLGVLIAGLAAVVIIPLPFTNFLPALAILLIALGLLERDGILILAGTALALLAFAIGGVIVYSALQLASALSTGTTAL